jgi:glycosyltransferase involved in cell wall biosynthesis
MSQNPLISVVIPSLNQGRFIQSAIESVLAQRYSSFEVIVIDGGSSDESLAVIKRFERVLHYWESEPDRGQSHALNKGFARARGEIFVWLNADDLLIPGALAGVAEIARDTQPDRVWITGSVVKVDEQSRIRRAIWNPGDPEAAVKRGLVTVGCPSTFFSRKLMQRCGNFREDLNLSMDTDLWNRFALSGYRCRVVPRYLFAFREHAGSKTAGPALRSATEGRNAILAARLERKLAASQSGAEVDWRWQDMLVRRLRGVFGGSYLRSMFDTARWRGRKLADVFPS